MERYKRILVATDGSEHAELALKRGIYLALRHNSRLFICHVVESREYSRVPVFRDEIKQAAVENGLNILKESKKQAEQAGLAYVETIIKRDPFPQKKMAEDVLPLYSIDLVVTGSSGLGPIERYVLGSVSSGMAHRAECDVLVVRNKNPLENYKRILICIDESSMAVNAFTAGLDLAETQKAEVTAVHVLHTPLVHSLEQLQEDIQDVYLKNGELLLEKYKKLAAEKGNSDMTITLEYGSPKHTIPKETAVRFQSDLIIAGAVGAGREKGLRLGSVSEGIVRRADCDVLVARPRFLMPIED
ncbi:nucleotide-binding universal stress UspA family protein [Sinobaca qinghaiensis]|uniref:Nucleotide-binding universal stress UspA family protein n=1 Tax=Sinobaca qinghaiensis TaxID=342944 RepID=A0A419UX50_9BACL|nr:universal stress protein [Sinobaca qinghaiensis]RKD69706.1 nucleotide-binding universal stress UspA family protein [Sinobaca qinghaiensis]